MISHVFSYWLLLFFAPIQSVFLFPYFSPQICKSEKDVFSVLARSLAPSIHGHEFVKKALLCQLLGGTEKVLPNGSR